MSKSQQLEVSVVMPCPNEADTLETCIVKAQRALVENGIAGEIIVADNGSTDESPAIAARLGFALCPWPKGYGSALMGGNSTRIGKNLSDVVIDRASAESRQG